MISQTQLVAKNKVEAVVTLTKHSPIDLHLVPPPPRVPKSVTPHKIQENFEATKVSLTEEEVQALVGIDKNHRLLNSVGAFL